MSSRITIRKPDDWHLNVRDDGMLRAVLMTTRAVTLRRERRGFGDANRPLRDGASLEGCGASGADHPSRPARKSARAPQDDA